MKELKTATVSIRLTPEEKKQLQELAEKADISVSKLLHNMIFTNWRATNERKDNLH